MLHVLQTFLSNKVIQLHTDTYTQLLLLSLLLLVSGHTSWGVFITLHQHLFGQLLLPLAWGFILHQPARAVTWASARIGGIAGQAVTFFEMDFEGLGGDEHLLHTLAATVTHIVMERHNVIQEC